MMSADRLNFGPERRKRAQPAAIPRTRRQRRDLVMDVIHDRRGRMFFCVVQPEGSLEVFMLGQFPSETDAVRTGEKFMSDYLRGEQAQAA